MIEAVVPASGSVVGLPVTAGHRCSLADSGQRKPEARPDPRLRAAGARIVPGLALTGFHPRVFLVDDEVAAAAADDLGSGYFFQCPQ
jgi:hypothetical protein